MDRESVEEFLHGAGTQTTATTNKSRSEFREGGASAPQPHQSRDRGGRGPTGARWIEVRSNEYTHDHDSIVV